MRCNWNLARTIFGISLEYFDEMQIQFGSDKVWNCLKIFSARCNWNLARTIFGISLEYFRRDAIGIWLKQDLELP